jgi:hypothetical protein
MDPEATLRLAQKMLDKGRIEDSREALDNYWTWRDRGGYAPENGDDRAKRIGSILRQHDMADRAAD